MWTRSSATQATRGSLRTRSVPTNLPLEFAKDDTSTVTHETVLKYSPPSRSDEPNRASGEFFYRAESQASIIYCITPDGRASRSCVENICPTSTPSFTAQSTHYSNTLQPDEKFVNNIPMEEMFFKTCSGLIIYVSNPVAASNSIFDIFSHLIEQHTRRTEIKQYELWLKTFLDPRARKENVLVVPAMVVFDCRDFVGTLPNDELLSLIDGWSAVVSSYVYPIVTQHGTVLKAVSVLCIKTPDRQARDTTLRHFQIQCQESQLAFYEARSLVSLERGSQQPVSSSSTAISAAAAAAASTPDLTSAAEKIARDKKESREQRKAQKAPRGFLCFH
jgi:hypothetical protein